jgi:hypothetical protein
MGLGRMKSGQSLTQTYRNQTISWLVHSWSTFDGRVNHGQTRTHKTHHDLDLGEATTFPPYSILCASPRGPQPNDILSRDSQMGVSKFLKLGLLHLWGPITLCAHLWSWWGLKKSFSPHQELSNNMSHVTCTQGNWVDSRLLVVQFDSWPFFWP